MAAREHSSRFFGQADLNRVRRCASLLVRLTVAALLALAGEPRLSAGPLPRSWLSAEQENLLKRSYERCFLERHRAAGLRTSYGDAARAYLRELDAMSGEILDEDIDRAPKEADLAPGLNYISCRWFAPEFRQMARQAGPASIQCGVVTEPAPSSQARSLRRSNAVF